MRRSLRALIEKDVFLLRWTKTLVNLPLYMPCRTVEFSASSILLQDSKASYASKFYLFTVTISKWVQLLLPSREDCGFAPPRRGTSNPLKGHKALQCGKFLTPSMS